MKTSGRKSQRGFTYVGLLMAVAIIGIMLTSAGRVWKTTEQRERETQLLWVGQQYRAAIGSYYASGRGFPRDLEDLIDDQRSPVPKHHLRRLYPDPMTGKADWTPVLTPDGQGIMGIASSSNGVPIKRKGFEAIDINFENADCYCNWQFVFAPRGRWGAGRGSPAAGAGTPAPADGNGMGTPNAPDPSNPNNSFDPGRLGPLNPGRPNIGPIAPGVTVPGTNPPN